MGRCRGCLFLAFGMGKWLVVVWSPSLSDCLLCVVFWGVGFLERSDPENCLPSKFLGGLIDLLVICGTKRCPFCYLVIFVVRGQLFSGNSPLRKSTFGLGCFWPLGFVGVVLPMLLLV